MKNICKTGRIYSKFYFLLVLNLFFFLSVSAQVNKKPPVVLNGMPPYNTASVQTINTRADTLRNDLSITDFGAHSGMLYDNASAFQTAVDYAISHHRILTVPLGDFYISKSILCQNNGYQFSIWMRGIFSNKSASNEYLSKIIYTGKSGFALGIQMGRGVVIENLTILGQYTFINSITATNIGVIKFSDWVQHDIIDTRYNPYAGISIDPYPNKDGSQGGTSDVMINNCSVKQFMVGIVLSPNGKTTNAEMVSIIDDDVESCRIAIAICQDQSKEIHIDRFKCWAATYTILDGLTYGAGTGGGSVMIDGMNIAGCVNQLFNLLTDRFPLSARNVYSESLFRIGRVGTGAGANFDNFSIDFLSGPGLPEADYLLVGQANFHGGALRYYDNDRTHRLNLCNVNAMFRDMTINTPPMTISLYGMGVSTNPNPRFDNIHISCGNYLMNNGVPDTVYTINPQPAVIIDRNKWTASFAKPKYASLTTGQYILGCPTGKSGHFWDQGMNPSGCPTIQLGRITKITADSVYLSNVGLNAITGQGYDNIFLSTVK
jgi:hypothetical protein